MTKSIRISAEAHREVKIYCANKSGNITEVATIAIMRYLSERGHKTSKPKHQSLKK